MRTTPSSSSGSTASAGANGLTLGTGSGGSTIKGLDITNFTGNGIVVQSNGNFILGNLIGVDPTGVAQMPNGTFPSSGDGIRILNASNNQIGSPDPADRNITSGNEVDGIHVLGTLTTPATGNIIQGNFVGVAADGKSSVGNRTEPAPAPGTAEGNNQFGIAISGGNLNRVGGTAAGARNVDVANFKAAMVSVLLNPKFYWEAVGHITAADASTFANLLLPNMLPFQVGNTAGYGNFIGPGNQYLGNGRKLTDAVVHTTLAVLTKGVLTTDNVGDDNGFRVTDGSIDPTSGKPRAIAFPYIGAANLPLIGPGTRPNP